MACDHSALHSGGARYHPGSGQLRLVLVCDSCGSELRLIGSVEYQPRPRRLVAHLAELTARELGLEGEQVARVRFAALVCGQCRDQIPPEIVGKRGPLTPAEWVEVHRHPELGAALIADVSLEDIREWILCHRERPDGRGYPRALSGERIPLEARILSVADAYTAMVSDRPYRPRRTHEGACAELRRCAGTQFDERVVEAFLAASTRRNPLLARAAA
ncbi:MAG TPA: HD domain-containing phosphohydrolase [Solirubrobacteraceae bacterium]|nr:HD domain-containing phosphohydrolase [Solirubrobacteraceae bacterium]